MLKISKKIITYYIDIELTEKEEEILESIASSCNMTLSEYTRFLIKQKIHMLYLFFCAQAYPQISQYL